MIIPRRGIGVCLLICALALICMGCAQTELDASARSSPSAKLVAQDAFEEGLAQWAIELEQPGSIRARHGVLEIDVPAGATLWFKHELVAPVSISFEATAVAAGGPNDRVSDINVFWMARNADGTAPFTRPRSGAFADYNDLETYYVGLGGNWNTTTRFRRYIGDANSRPLLPQHDLSTRDVLLKPNQRQRIVLIADGRRVEYWRDGTRLFAYDDDAPYERGWFAIRTTRSHLRIERLRIHRL